MAFRLTKIANGKISAKRPETNDLLDAAPEHIQEDSVIAPSRPRVGYAFMIGGYRTSVVISEPDENGIFRTKNSTYKLETI